MTPDPLDLDAVEALCDAATPGPWQWRVNPTSRSFYLEGTPRSGNEFVMGFERWGMGSAQPTLRKWVDADCDGGGYHLLAKGVEFLKPIAGREHHQSWAQTVDQPDAAFIAAARTLVPALVTRLRAAEAECARLRGDASYDAGWNDAIRKGAAVCESRAASRDAMRDVVANNEARKCATAIETYALYDAARHAGGEG